MSDPAAPDLVSADVEDLAARRAPSADERQAGTDDPEAQAVAILEESEARTVDRDAAPSTHLEKRTSEQATPPP